MIWDVVWSKINNIPYLRKIRWKFILIQKQNNNFGKLLTKCAHHPFHTLTDQALVVLPLDAEQMVDRSTKIRARIFDRKTKGITFFVKAVVRDFAHGGVLHMT